MQRNIDVNGACCMEDKCNNKLPLVIMGAEVPTTQQPAMVVNTTADPNSCKNLDDGACQRLALASPGICSDTCFAENVCPRMCGSCLNCYTCNDIDNITDCTTINVCQSGHSYCESHCARLVDFSSRSNMQDVFALLVPHRQGIYQDERVWTDATYSHSNWVWSHSGHYISSRSFRNLVHSHSTSQACGFAMVHTSSGGFVFAATTTEDLVADSCTKQHLPLCEASRKLMYMVDFQVLYVKERQN
ncbi:unnamed protein product [Mytilus coruscus]|uniref:C-type lectin domain-containing protein n=1 Tax=Mytilus coruscus TaxID=42192 RepID=A0A6J8AZI9_MYTCO|nr:unnamed protein product [Mytilus coruscus]